MRAVRLNQSSNAAGRKKNNNNELEDAEMICEEERTFGQEALP